MRALQCAALSTERLVSQASDLPALFTCWHVQRDAERVVGTVQLDNGRHAPLVFRVCGACYLHTLATLTEEGPHAAPG
jgi:hypothetical protein